MSLDIKCTKCGGVIVVMSELEKRIKLKDIEINNLKETMKSVVKDMEEDGYHYPNTTLIKMYNVLEIGPDYTNEASSHS